MTGIDYVVSVVFDACSLKMKTIRLVMISSAQVIFRQTAFVNDCNEATRIEEACIDAFAKFLARNRVQYIHEAIKLIGA